MVNIEQAIASILQGHFLPEIDPDSEWREQSGRYLLFERGHYGQTWLTRHDSLDDASRYTLNQECAEDWNAEAVLDTQTGDTFRPSVIVWDLVARS